MPFFRCSKIQGEAGKQEILQQFSENSRCQIVFRTDIFRKLTLGAPGQSRRRSAGKMITIVEEYERWYVQNGYDRVDNGKGKFYSKI